MELKNKELKHILENIKLLSVEYSGKTWTIGDAFHHKHDSEETEDVIEDISLVNYDEKENWKTELVIGGEFYAIDIEECYKK